MDPHAPSSAAAPSASPKRQVRRQPSALSPSLSVAIVNYHHWADTANLVEQLNTSDRLRLGLAEVVIVDNHSQADPTIHALRRVEGVSLRRWQQNRGFARAVNEGCRLSQGDWFLLLNPDVTLSNDFLEQAQKLADSLAKHSPAIGIVGLGLRDPDGSRQYSTGAFPTLFGTLAGLCWPRAWRKYRPAPAGRLSTVGWVTGCGLLVRRACWEQLGGFDPSFFLYYEDVDLCRRAQCLGWSVCHEPGLTLTHHCPLHTRAVSPPLRSVTRHALLTYARKHWRWWQFFLLCWVVRLEAWWRARAHAYAGMPSLSVHLPLSVRSPATSAGATKTVRNADFSASSAKRNAMPPSLSLVIPSHKRADLLRLCLRSIRRHAPADVQVIVVDDASPKGLISQAARDFPEVVCLRQRRRGGFCAAVNAGIAAATAPIVELLNDDTEVTANWAEPALACFADLSVAAVAPLVLQGPPSRTGPIRIDSAGDRYYLGGVAGKRGHGKVLEDRDVNPGPVFGASGSSAFYRRAALLQVGGFPEQFGAYFEDIDLAFRLHRAGYHVHFEPTSIVWHRVSSSYGSANWNLLARQSRNEERVFWRNLPGPSLWKALPRHCAVLVAKAARRLSRGELVPFLCGRLGVLAEVRHLWRHRRELAASGVSRTNRPNGAWRAASRRRKAQARQPGNARFSTTSSHARAHPRAESDRLVSSTHSHCISSAHRQDKARPAVSGYFDSLTRNTMIRTLFTALLLIVPMAAAPALRADDTKDFFNGKDLTGWEGLSRNTGASRTAPSSATPRRRIPSSTPSSAARRSTRTSS